MGDGRLGYVLLLGDAYDASDVPLLPSFYGYANHSITPTSLNDFYRASDAYYSFLDADPYTDRFPDVAIGRLPVDDDATDWEISNLVRKIVRYEPLPIAAWTDSVLMVSGSDDDEFTFEGEGLSGFQAFFDSVSAYYAPPGRQIIQLHRLSNPSLQESAHQAFGDTFAANIKRGKWLTAFFDHGTPFYWVGAFYARSYETFATAGRPTVVLSIGSNTSQFDLTANWAATVLGSCSVGQGCMVAPPSSINCESPGYQSLDKCDVIAERLLVQPGGAVAVIGYSRTQLAPYAQADFTNLFRSLSDQNPSTLGEFLVGARMFRISDNVVARNLMLLGDPALDIRTRAPALPDTFDVAVGTLDIRSPWSTYMRASGSPIEVTVHNIWKTDVYDLEVELWRGEPGGQESTLLESEVIDTLRAYGPETVTFSVSGPQGNVRLYVVLDPDDLIAERAEDNNIASRDLIAMAYKGAYPTRLPFLSARRSVTIADLTSAPGKEFLVVGLNVSGNLIQCYAVGDTSAVWTYSTGSFPMFVKNQPAVGHAYKSASSYVAVEWGSPSSVRILSGLSGSVVKTRAVGDTRGSGDSWEAKWLLTDLGADDPAMELVTLKYVDGASSDSLHVRAFAPNGTALFSRRVDVANTVQPATMAVGDLDRNGSKEIVTLQALASGASPASGKELTVLSYGAGGLTRKWQADVANGGSIAAPAVVLVDADGDGDLSILCNGALPGPVLRLYDADSTLVWTKSDFTVTAGYPAIYFSAGDVDGNGSAEVVVTDHERVRILPSSDGSVLYSRAMVGDPVAPPLLADLDADGKLDVVVMFEQKDPNDDFVPEHYWTYLNILDESLDLSQPGWTLRTQGPSAGSCLPAIDDIDDDGKYEMVYVSPDQYLHVFELGSAAGDAAWSQRFANPLNTGLNEQPILGDGYTNPVSLYQRTRMLGHVSLDSLAAPSLYVGHGTEVSVDASIADPYQLRAYGSVRVKGSTAAPVVFRSEPPATDAATWGGLYVDDRFASGNDPDTLSHLELSDALIGVHGRSPLYVNAATISNAFERGVSLVDAGTVVVAGLTVGGVDYGINAREGTTVLLANSTIADCLLYGVAVYQNSKLDATGTTFDGNAIATYLAKETGSWVAGSVYDCTFTGNDDGIQIIDVDSSVVIDNCVIDDNTTSGIYVEGGGDITITSNTIANNTIGVYSYGGNPAIRSHNVIQYNAGGISCDDYSTAVVESCTVNNNTNGVVVANGANPDLGHETGGSSLGQNIMRPNTAYHVVNFTSNDISAQINYIPRNPPTQCDPPATKFYGSVVYEPHLGCDAPDLSAPSAMLAGVEEALPAQQIPTRFNLRHNYPNPFNPVTTIAYEIPAPGSRVEIALYDVGGRLVAVLVDEHQTPGFYSVTWNGVNRNGEPVASGVYFLRMRAGHFVDTKKVLLLK